MMKRDEVLTNLKKAQSHLAKVVGMVEEDRYCVDIMQQQLAVIGLLKSAHQMLMASHLNHCFKEAVGSDDDALKQKMVEEILTVTKLANR